MTYEEALKQIHALHRFKKVPGLVHLRNLLHALGDPQEKLPCVHVAGTNGKGSTSTMIASMLRKSRYRTGLFVSPFVTDFCERIQLNNRPIPHREFAQAAEDVLPLILEMESRGKNFLNLRRSRRLRFTGLPNRTAMLWFWKWALAADWMPPM